MKKRIKWIAFLTLFAFSLTLAGQAYANEDTQKSIATQGTDEPLGRLFRNSYDVFKDLRNEVGVYRDSILLEPGDNYHPSSVASTGIGLMSLTIADQKNWEEAALEKAKQTVATMTDQRAGFHADRTSNGFYRHFINMQTGAQEWNSEYSTVDTAIFLVGALFAENYFKDPAFSESVKKLYDSIDFEASIADSDTGGIYLTMNEDGTGGANSITLPYNEYIIVAWLAYNQNIDNPESKAVKLWKNHYETPKNLLTKPFNEFDLLTDHPEHFVSSFTLLFPYYMVNMFSKSEEYRQYIDNAYQADKRWSELSQKTQAYEWGSGAGASPEGYGYHADAINDNQALTISPHIIAGFLPVNPSGSQDLLALYTNKKGLYQLQSDPSKEILWRYSIEEPTWKANSIQGIDYSTFLFGLATLDQEMGLSFFQTNNHFFKTVTFDLNGGTSELPSSQHLAVNDRLKPTSQPTRPGYRFTGWQTKADGSGTVWDFSADSTPETDLTLYAQWQRDSRVVSFDLNGGTSEKLPVQSVEVGAQVVEPTSIPTRLGYVFTGWQTKADGSGTVWDFPTALMPDADVTLYAQWLRVSRRVSFDLNGGTGEQPTAQEVVVGDNVQEPTLNPTRSGFSFIGWHDGEGHLWHFDKMKMPNNDLTLYAHWQKVSIEATETASGGTSTRGSSDSANSTLLPKTGEKDNFLTILGVAVGGCWILLYRKSKGVR